MGKALVLDARVSCQRPHIENLRLVAHRDATFLNGSYSATESVYRLAVPGHPVAFGCPVIQPDSRSYALVICQAPGQNIRDGKLVSEFRSTDAWLAAMNSTYDGTVLDRGIADGPYLIINLTVRNTGHPPRDESHSQTTSAHGAWIDIDGIESENYSFPPHITASLSLCYPAFSTARLDLELHSKKNRTEPTPQKSGRSYSTSPNVLDQMGLVPDLGEM